MSGKPFPGCLLIGWGLLALFSGTVATRAAADPPPGYRLIWADEFNQGEGNPPTASNWTYDLGGGGWGNEELQVYVNDTVHACIVDEPEATDALALRIRSTRQGDSYTSARIKTQGIAAFQYGYVEARIRLPFGQGIWPAFWMLGANFGGVGWPTSGEIDIMEHIGKEPDAVYSTLHGPGYSGDTGIGNVYRLPGGGQFKDAWHVFSARWQPNAVTFAVDGVEYATRTLNDLPQGAPWVFNKPFFFILNLAVGGRWPGSPDASTTFPQDYLVDYLRVYEMIPPVGRVVTLKSLANGKYVTAGPDGNAQLIAASASASLPERFLVECAEDDAVALKSLVNGRYVSAVGGSPLSAAATSIGPSERFEWVDASDNAIALRSVSLQRFVCAESGGDAPLIADRNIFSTWESFTVAATEPIGASASTRDALGVVAGLTSASPEAVSWLRVVDEPGLTLTDAAGLARRATGLAP